AAGSAGCKCAGSDSGARPSRSSSSPTLLTASPSARCQLAVGAARAIMRGLYMATISTNQFRPGVKILVEGDPCNIIENEFVKPGKGQAFNRVKYRNLNTGRV